MGLVQTHTGIVQPGSLHSGGRRVINLIVPSTPSYSTNNSNLVASVLQPWESDAGALTCKVRSYQRQTLSVIFLSSIKLLHDTQC